MLHEDGTIAATNEVMMMVSTRINGALHHFLKYKEFIEAYDLEQEKLSGLNN